MTDDFHLFGDPDDGDRPIDPDLALMSAYLARELSPLQVLAIEERLATDVGFRRAMQPLLDAWAAPLPSLGGEAARHRPALSELERDESWRRFLREAQPASAAVRQVQPRRSSMKRAAAVVALVVVPMASFAQVVVYAANHPDARGHAIAKRIVAPFERESFEETPGARRAGEARTSTAAPREVDTGALLPVPTAPVFELEPVPVSVKGVTTPAPSANAASAVSPPANSGLSSLLSLQEREPNRARIAELARQHQPTVVNSDSATYIVMVLDAADSYVWSTAGRGNLAIEVLGDTRTPLERSAYNRRYHAEFWGSSVATAGRGGRVYSLGVDSAMRSGAIATPQSGGALSGGGRGRAAAVDHRDSSVGDRDITRAVGNRMIIARDSLRRLRIDSVQRRGQGAVTTLDSPSVVLRAEPGQGARGATGGIIVRGGRGAAAAGGADRGSGLGGGGAEGGSPILAFDRETGAYRGGWYGTPNGAAPNQAEGLTAAGNGESGIEGVPSTAVASAETYYFAAGELAPSALKVIVVHLVPGTTWRRRF